MLVGVFAILASIIVFRYRLAKKKDPYSSRLSFFLQSTGLQRATGSKIIFDDASYEGMRQASAGNSNIPIFPVPPGTSGLGEGVPKKMRERSDGEGQCPE